MFGALKKFVQNVPDINNNQRNKSGVNPQTMQVNLQKKFSKGIQYNMKILIKGDRNVGKSCLFERLQGKPFIEEYIPTPEIQVAHIHWNYKATDDVVKVEIWDVVDKGKKKNQMSPMENNLKINNTNNISQIIGDASFDAEFVDIYQGSQGIVLMLDITKRWTLDYVKKELPKIPNSLPILVLGNHRDMGHHRTIATEEIFDLISHVEKMRPPGSAYIKFAESSMKNAFGLKYVHKFFSLPFLLLQRETLLGLLETNSNHIMILTEELDFCLQSPDCNYETFVTTLHDKKDKKTNSQPPEISKTTALPLPVSITSPGPTPVITITPQSYPQALQPTTSAPPTLVKTESHCSSRPSQIPLEPALTPSQSKLRSLDEFAPKEVIDTSFLDEDFNTNVRIGNQNHPRHDVKGCRETSHSSEDEDNNNHNPMVMVYQDDLDSNEEEESIGISAPQTSEIISPCHNSQPWDRRIVLTPVSGNSDIVDSPPSSIFEILEPVKIVEEEPKELPEVRTKSHKKDKKHTSHKSHSTPSDPSQEVKKSGKHHKSRSHKKRNEAYEEI